MIEKIAQALTIEGFDGWLFYNFKNIDPSANHILNMPTDALFSRRWYYFVPAKSEPIKLVHAIEAGSLDHLPGKKLIYAGWKELHAKLAQLLEGTKRICMQYSPFNAIPYVAFVDAGTIELVKSTGVEVYSSANLIQSFEATWSDHSIELHKKAAQKVRKIVDQAFAKVRDSLAQKEDLSEYKLQQFVIEKLEEEGLFFDHGPIVAFNAHSGDPHFEPSSENSPLLKEGDFILIDLWGKEKEEDAVYADITWTGYVGKEVPEVYEKVFSIVRDARDAAVELIQKKFAAGEEVYGYEVDDACRGVIDSKGYGKYFIHRTGHSIERELHGKGVNIDNWETKDERKLIDRIGFSIEPGIYLEEFGIRSEINAYIKDNHVYVSGSTPQEAIIPILLEKS